MFRKKSNNATMFKGVERKQMKTELRTLKDLDKFNHKDLLGEWLIDERELKAEAVKWVKHLKMTGEDNVFDFLETFFNLTEEDGN